MALKFMHISDTQEILKFRRGDSKLEEAEKNGVYFTASVCICTKSVWATVHYT